MGFQQGLSGLNAAAHNLDVIGNNVANANTAGFKQGQAQFADVYASSLAGSSGVNIGIGTSVSGVVQQFAQGNIETSSNPLDIAVNGAGFFRLDNNGTVEYSRNGQFHTDKNGFIVNANGAKVTGYGIDASGNVVTANPSPLTVSTSDLSPSPTSKASVVLNVDSRAAVPATSPFSMANTATYNYATSLSTFDSLGNSHTLTTYYVKTAANTWSVYGANDGTLIGNLGTLNYKSDGSIDTATTTLPFNVSVALANGATTPLAYTLDFTGSTQFGSVFGVSKLAQDGFTSGNLSGFTVSADGTLQGRYSNGQTRTLGQLVLANFSDPQGLQPLGNNVWAETATSGQPLVGAPASGTLGTLQSGAIEASNVDLTAQLVDMITAQRVYQANAQTIKTQDAVLQTLVNLR